MPDCRIIDAFPAFLEYWQKFQARPITEQLEGWAAFTRAGWPELFDKQVADYVREGSDWRAVAAERILPNLPARLPGMHEAHANLLEYSTSIYAAAQEKFGYDLSLTFVFYVGIGLGAGWATPYEQAPALLFGLENIAEEGWSGPLAIRGLISHEIGHLAHFRWRARADLPNGTGPLWQLYEEGFAQCCEHALAGQDTWHMTQGSGSPDWLAWCQAHTRWLAQEFLRRLQTGDDIRPFFGSWFDLQGYKQCGYFLGHELIRALEAQFSLAQVAVLENSDNCMLQLLQELATP